MMNPGELFVCGRWFYQTSKLSIIQDGKIEDQAYILIYTNQVFMYVGEQLTRYKKGAYATHVFLTHPESKPDVPVEICVCDENLYMLDLKPVDNHTSTVL